MHNYLQQGYEWIPTSSTFQQHHPTKLDIYDHPMVIKGERERESKARSKAGETISVAAPQHLQYHQKGERERRKAGDTYKRCGTATPTIPSEGERERRKAGDIYKRCGTATPTIPSEGREREEKSW